MKNIQLIFGILVVFAIVLAINSVSAAYLNNKLMSKYTSVSVERDYTDQYGNDDDYYDNEDQWNNNTDDNEDDDNWEDDYEEDDEWSNNNDCNCGYNPMCSWNICDECNPYLRHGYGLVWDPIQKRFWRMFQFMQRYNSCCC